MARAPKVLMASAVAGLMFAAPAVTNAHTAVVEDPDEPSLADRYDIEWAAVEHPPSVSGRLVRHTIRTRAPYGTARTPRLFLRAPSEIPGKYRFYRIAGTTMCCGCSPRACIRYSPRSVSTTSSPALSSA